MCLYYKKITNNTAPHDQDGQFTLQWVDIKAILHFKCLFTYEIGQNKPVGTKIRSFFMLSVNLTDNKKNCRQLFKIKMKVYEFILTMDHKLKNNLNQ